MVFTGTVNGGSGRWGLWFKFMIYSLRFVVEGLPPTLAARSNRPIPGFGIRIKDRRNPTVVHLSGPNVYQSLQMPIFGNQRFERPVRVGGRV